MAYCTQAEIETMVSASLVVQLTDDLNTGSAIAATVNDAIAKADALIDAHLRNNHHVPIAVVPELVNMLSVDLAVYYLFIRRAHSFEMPEWVVTKHDDSLSLLRDIRAGAIDVGIEPPPPTSSAQIADTDGPERLFTEDTLAGF